VDQYTELTNLHTHFNVATQDPELLTPLPGSASNRAQTAERYLRRLCTARYRNLTYNKSNGNVIRAKTYFEQIRNRLMSTSHIQSFGDFESAFK
jgi:hypothetical protein